MGRFSAKNNAVVTTFGMGKVSQDYPHVDKGGLKIVLMEFMYVLFTQVHHQNSIYQYKMLTCVHLLEFCTVKATHPWVILHDLSGL